MLNSRRRLAAIMFTDLVGYSAISNRDERLALELLEEHRVLIRPLFVEHGGREVKTIGDAFLVEFDSALEAVRCGIRIQERISLRNIEAERTHRIKVRIGIHLGDIVVAQDDVYGDGVNIAARLEQQAAPGAICFSQQVYDQVQNKLELPVVVRRSTLKGIRGETRIYQVKPSAQFDTTSPGFSVPKLARNLQVKRRRTAFALGGITMGLAVALTAWLSAPRRTVDLRPEPGAALASDRIAVLPFRTTGLAKGEEYMADAILEDLISSLSKLPGARVIARSSVARYRDTQVPIARIATELNAATLLEGSLRKTRDRLKITVSLVDPRNETTLWAEEYEGRAEDAYQLHSKIAQSVSSRLRMRQIAAIQPGGTASAAPDHEAFLNFIRGRFFLNQRTKDGFEKGIALFKKAIELDPTFQSPYVGLANSYGFMGYYEYMSPKEALLKGMFYSERALTLDPESPDALTSTASRKMYYDHDWQGAEAFFTRALEIRPNYPSAHSWYADFLVARGRLSEAKRELAQALDLDPLSLIINTSAGHPHYFGGDYDAAIKRYQSVLEMDSNFFPAQLWLGRAYLRKQDFQSAIHVLFTALKTAPGSSVVRATLGQALARAGRRVEALKLRDELASPNPERYVGSYDLAALDLALGDRDRALAGLERAYEERSYHVVFAGIDPAFTSIAEEPRFRALVERVRSTRR